ncbi:hypothetical protein PSYMO_38508, partial [Pseudomonas amygdali pv. mori str. 301020]
ADPRQVADLALARLPASSNSFSLANKEISVVST